MFFKPHSPTSVGAALLGLACVLTTLPVSNAHAKKKAHTAAHKGGHATQPTEASVAYGRSEAVLAFARQVSERHPELDRVWVENVLQDARRLPIVERLIMPAATPSAKNWMIYRARFMDPLRQQEGRRFLKTHAQALQRAEDRYGVPAEVVAAIIGIETIYGRNTGNFRILDTLATLSFNFPTGRSDRSGFFRSELEQFLVLCKRDHLDPLSARGSYAGAMGLAQFMPGTWLNYAVDFNDDGRIDLLNDTTDVIGSVAAYLHASGWQRGVPTHFAVSPPKSDTALATLLGPDIQPSFSAYQFTNLGAQLDQAGQEYPELLALVMLRNGTELPPDFVAGTSNFWAISRYNWSAYYTMAVIELSQALANRRQK
ncbi:MAG: lytic murein transglycosylase B [Leptothrix ochracea]|uniref:lytic murein transglycosylase B n=1 Tax=Leptothrix ochracea TaxID=735331 RepID=UPI0034E1B8F7